ncbi:MAG: extracellular solute-binding protein [Acidilobus sp.]
MNSLSRGALAAIVIIIVVVAVAGGLAYSMRRHVTTSSPTTSSMTTTATTTQMTTTTSTSMTVSSPETLTVVTYTGKTGQGFMEFAAHLFEEEHPNVKVNVIAFPFTQYISNELTELQSGQGQYDIVTYTPANTMEFVPYLVPLNSTYVNISDLFYPVQALGGTVGNVTYGVARGTSVMLLAYYANYFDNATLQQEFRQEYGFSLNPWTWNNWSQLADASQFFTSHHITKYGILLWDQTGDLDLYEAYALVFEWYYMHSPSLNCGNVMGLMPLYGDLFMGCIPSGWNHGFPPPAFNSTAGVEALEVQREIVSYMPPPTALLVSYDNVVPLLEQPNYAPGAFIFAAQLSYFTNMNNLTDIRLAPAPGGYALGGATFFGVSKYSAHKQLALEFISFIASPQVQAASFYNMTNFPISKQAYQLLLENSSLPSYEREWINATFYAAEHAYAAIPAVSISTTALEPALEKEVLGYLEGQITNASQALQQAAQAWVQDLESYSTSTSTTASAAAAPITQPLAPQAPWARQE